MFSETFNPFLTKSITFYFNCTKCGTEIEETITNLPKPRMDTEKDTHNETLDTDVFEIICPKCGVTYSVRSGASILAGELYSDDLPDDTKIEREERD